MKLDRLDNGMKIAAASGAALIVFMFFPWYGRTSEAFPDREFGVNVNAWQAFELIDLVLFVAAALVITVAFLEATGRRVRAPIDASPLVAAVGALGALLVIYRLIDTPFDLERKYGLFLGLIAAIGVAAGGRISMGERGETFAGARDELGERVAQARDDAATSISSGSPRYEDWSREDLYEEASRQGIEGRSEMNKEELADALRGR